MRFFALASISSIFCFCVVSSVAHAQVAGRLTTVQVGPATLFGREFSLNLCQGTTAADIQCVDDSGEFPKCPNGKNDASPKSHTCDPGRVVSCEGIAHWRRNWVVNWLYAHRQLFLGSPDRYRIDFENGSITEVNRVRCKSNGDYEYAEWNDGPLPFGIPTLSIVGFSDHIRQAFARGTIIAQIYSGSQVTLLIEQLKSDRWHLVASKTTISQGSSSGIFEVTGYVDPSADVRMAVLFRSADESAEVTLRDVRLFVEQCVPDTSRPGQCLGDS